MAVQVSAGMAEIIDVGERLNGDNNSQMITTLANTDTSCQHYADERQLLDESGKTINTRVLLIPMSISNLSIAAIP